MSLLSDLSDLGRSVQISIVTCSSQPSSSDPWGETDEDSEEERKSQSYRSIRTAVINTHRSVVLQLDFHHRLEDAVFDPLGLVEVLHLGDKSVVEATSGLDIGCVVEIGFIAFFDVSVQCEL